MRISRDKMLMMQAHVAALRGTCHRLRVGAVIAHQSRPVSLGYNGAPAGEPHCNPQTCNSDNPCNITDHAEMNALLWAKTFGVDVRGATMYVTDSPCINCAREIVFHGIKRVVYDRAYRCQDGILYLTDNDIEVIQCEISTDVLTAIYASTQAPQE